MAVRQRPRLIAHSSSLMRSQVRPSIDECGFADGALYDDKATSETVASVRDVTIGAGELWRASDDAPSPLVDAATSVSRRAASTPRVVGVRSLALSDASTLVVVAQGDAVGTYDQLRVEQSLNITGGDGSVHVRALVDALRASRRADNSASFDLQLDDVVQSAALVSTASSALQVVVEPLALGSACASVSGTGSIDSNTGSISLSLHVDLVSVSGGSGGRESLRRMTIHKLISTFPHLATDGFARRPRNRFERGWQRDGCDCRLWLCVCGCQRRQCCLSLLDALQQLWIVCTAAVFGCGSCARRQSRRVWTDAADRCATADRLEHNDCAQLRQRKVLFHRRKCIVQRDQ